MAADNSITEAEITTWVSTLDTNSTEVKRVLGAIQILDSVLLTKILFYMVRGYMDISKLYTMDINNLSIKTLINSLDQATYTDIDKVYFYRDKIKQLSGFKNYLDSLRTNTTMQITRETAVINRYLLQVSIDALGFSDTTYSSVNVVKSLYDTILKDQSLISMTSIINSNSNKLATAYGYSNINNFTSLILGDIANYFLIYTNNTSMPLKLNNSSIITWFMRRQYLDAEYVDFLNNFNYILKYISTGYATDTQKLGIPKLTELNTAMSFSTCFSHSTYNNPDSFYDSFLKTVLIKVVFISKVYGNTYFNSTLITNINKEYADIIAYFSSISDYIDAILNAINTKFIGTTNGN